MSRLCFCFFSLLVWGCVSFGLDSGLYKMGSMVHILKDIISGQLD